MRYQLGGSPNQEYPCVHPYKNVDEISLEHIFSKSFYSHSMVIQHFSLAFLFLFPDVFLQEFSLEHFFKQYIGNGLTTTKLFKKVFERKFLEKNVRKQKEEGQGKMLNYHRMRIKRL
jgi:hypothetical protein